MPNPQIALHIEPRYKLMLLLILLLPLLVLCCCFCYYYHYCYYYYYRCRLLLLLLQHTTNVTLLTLLPKRSELRIENMVSSDGKIWMARMRHTECAGCCISHARSMHMVSTCIFIAVADWVTPRIPVCKCYPSNILGHASTPPLCYTTVTGGHAGTCRVSYNIHMAQSGW